MDQYVDGSVCLGNKNTALYNDPTIGDLLADAGVPWAFYIEGYQEMVDAQIEGVCPPPPSECAPGVSLYPCIYDPTDISFQYYERFRDNPEYMKDLSRFEQDVAAGTLPAVSFVKELGLRTEHTGYGITIAAGMEFTQRLIDRLLASPYADDRLVLVVTTRAKGTSITSRPRRTAAWTASRTVRACRPSLSDASHAPTTSRMFPWSTLRWSVSSCGTGSGAAPANSRPATLWRTTSVACLTPPKPGTPFRSDLQRRRRDFARGRPSAAVRPRRQETGWRFALASFGLFQASEVPTSIPPGNAASNSPL